MRTLPGTLSTPTAGPILCPGAPVRYASPDADGYELEWTIIAFTGDEWRMGAYADGVGHTGYESADAIGLDLTADLGPTIALRWLGRHYGLTFGVGGPGWRYNEALLAWFLKGDGYNNDIGFASDAVNMKPTDHAIPGISEIRDPLEALVAACLHAAGVIAMTIWKFPVPVSDRFIVNMPRNARPLSVQVQHNDVCMWALVDPAAPIVRREFRVFGTGHPIDLSGGSQTGTFVGTFQVYGGDLVFHLFDYGVTE